MWKSYGSGKLRQRTEQFARAVPKDLHSNAHQKECGELKNHVRPRGTQLACQTIGVAVAEIDGYCQESGTDRRRENFQQVCAQVLRRIRSQSDGNRDGTGTNCQREGQRVERLAQSISASDCSSGRAVIPAFLIQHRPAGCNHDQPTADLHNRERNPEEGEYVRPQDIGRDQQYETIYRNAASQRSSCLGRVVLREQQKDRTASNRIDDRKERAHDQENTLGNLNDQTNLPSAPGFESSPVRGPVLPEPMLQD